MGEEAEWGDKGNHYPGLYVGVFQVMFIGEEAQDAGGVKKVCQHLILGM